MKLFFSGAGFVMSILGPGSGVRFQPVNGEFVAGLSHLCIRFALEFLYRAPRVLLDGGLSFAANRMCGRVSVAAAMCVHSHMLSEFDSVVRV